MLESKIKIKLPIIEISCITIDALKWLLWIPIWWEPPLLLGHPLLFYPSPLHPYCKSSIPITNLIVRGNNCMMLHLTSKINSSLELNLDTRNLSKNISHHTYRNMLMSQMILLNKWASKHLNSMMNRHRYSQTFRNKRTTGHNNMLRNISIFFQYVSSFRLVDTCNSYQSSRYH